MAQQFEIKGNQLAGVSVKMFNKEVVVVRKLTWYEIALSILVFIPCVLFGAVGGAIGGLLAFTNVTIIRSTQKLYLKILISILLTIAGGLLSYIVAGLVLGLMSPIL